MLFSLNHWIVSSLNLSVVTKSILVISFLKLWLINPTWAEVEPPWFPLVTPIPINDSPADL
ncbi:hypothetical protein [Mycoplasmopsis meleagridis]|uniref:hypothetical protein n=1 Tax=Mycoplasmopsis meleagridis TaxID=29561 RepID=UPI00101BCC3E|nr:hypothetical protein [Mycoplasmopsis meleagridis]